MSVINSTNYWEKIFEELQSEIERNGHAKYLYIAKRYDVCIKTIEDKIRAWYGRNALDYKTNLRQAYKKLPKDQLEQFHSMIEEYLRYWNEELGYDKDELKVSEKDTTVRENRTDEDVRENRTTESLSDTTDWIEVLKSYRDRPEVTQYESLLIPILQEVEVVSNETSNALLELLVLTGWAVHYDVTKNLKVQALAQEQIKKELLKAWSADNMNLYERFNVNKAKLSTAVKSALIQSFRNEASVDDVITEISKLMGINENAAKRLVLTENAHFNTHATYLALKQAKYTHYRYICRLLPTSCEDCIALHNTVFRMEDYEAGVTAPPLHPNCLCYLVGEVIE